MSNFADWVNGVAAEHQRREAGGLCLNCGEREATVTIAGPVNSWPSCVGCWSDFELTAHRRGAERQFEVLSLK